MMKILAIIGSPRSNGNTYMTVKKIEEVLVQNNREIELEYVQLSQSGLELCKGCYVCIARGEELCPLKDERESLEKKIKEADALIFASPVYTYNLPWIFKNFFDRFAYRCHRPDFHGKKAMVVASTAAIGLRFVIMTLSFNLSAMGFITCAKVGLTFSPPHERDNRKWEREIAQLTEQTEKFYRKIIDPKPVKPSLLKLITFKKQQKAFSMAPQHLADYRFWQEKGWLEKSTDYYYKVRMGKAGKIAAALVARVKV